VPPSRSLAALAIGLASLAPVGTRAGDAGAGVVGTDVLTASGYSGGALTPSARTLPYGTLGLRYDPQLVGVAERPHGHNAVLGIGVLPFVEVTGRVAAHDMHCNLYLPGDCDGRGWLRDLSASVKAAVPLDAKQRFSIAAGAVDVGGAATNFRTYYGVAGWREGPFDLSLGYGRSEARYGVLNGAFGRVAVRLHESLEVAAERVPAGTWISARAFAPARWLPDRWQLYADLNHRVGDAAATAPSWVGIGIGIALDRRGDSPSAAEQRAAASRPPQPLFGGPSSDGAAAVPAAPLAEPPTSSRAEPPAAPRAEPPAAPRAEPPAARRVDVAPAPTALEPAATQRTAAGGAGQDPTAARPGLDGSMLQRLRSALERAGVVDLAIGEGRDTEGRTIVVVRADNGAWRWSDLDALGAVVGRSAAALADRDLRLRVVLGRRGVPTLGIDGTVPCIQAWLRRAESDCEATGRPRLLAAGESGFPELLDDVRWLDRGLNPSWGRTRIAVAPGLRTAVATEYGVWDYSLAAEVDVEVPLWRGASIDARRSFPLSHSGDFDDRRVYGLDRHRTLTDRVLVHQTIPIANGLAARAVYGRVFDDWRGGVGELRWQPGDGSHRFGAMLGQFQNGGSLRKGFTAEPALVSYRYFIAPLDWSVEATVGRFFLNDTGWALSSRHWFGEVAVVAHLRETRHPYAAVGERFAGLLLEIPLTPRRAFDRRWLQLQGADRWAYGIETLVGNSHNRITGGHGVVPPVTNGLSEVHDTDRSFGAFAARNRERVREAAAADAAR
jgi:hypothetical protein